MMSISKYLHIASLHDCYLQGISLLDDNDLKLVICNLNGEVINIICTKMDYCRFDAFREGNIIFGLDLYDNSDIDEIFYSK